MAWAKPEPRRGLLNRLESYAFKAFSEPSFSTFAFNDSAVRRFNSLNRFVIVVCSVNANARNYRLPEDVLRLERRCPCCAHKIQSSLYRKGYHPESGVSLGDGNQEWAATFALC